MRGSMVVDKGLVIRSMIWSSFKIRYKYLPMCLYQWNRSFVGMSVSLQYFSRVGQNLKRSSAFSHEKRAMERIQSSVLQYACLKLSKPGLAPWPWHHLPSPLCQCRFQLATVAAANAGFSLAYSRACSPRDWVSSFISFFLPLNYFL